ncbi:HK97 gp10 family phage protein [Paenibacillus sp. MAH-36]|uniref:HK97 gp10 family phage protein n=1 Tax=Paenibacillus violae TaxID=3077234 RepID=A0ABU3R7X5_9BACL|nr:HK97 gp10 family phage protein [Paenibacillus sp. PFR10]MDU0200161.1 HK97 gp10 family phage protein [Paenibacillus sp. PFR10]
MSNGDMRELDEFVRHLVSVAAERLPRESKKFLREEGTKLRKITLARAKSSVKKKTGNYYKSIKRGKVYDYDGVPSVRVYSKSPHAHLIEDGHRIVGPDGTEHGFQPGLKVFEKASNDFEEEYVNDTEAFIDKLLREGRI